MNERIRKLMSQAGFDPAAIERMGVMPQAEKFAELIVRECANKVSHMVIMDKGYIPQDPHSKGWNGAAAYASKELKRYFGVEE